MCGYRGHMHVHLCAGCTLDQLAAIRPADRRRPTHECPYPLCFACGRGTTESDKAVCERCVPLHPDETHIVSLHPRTDWWTLALQCGGYRTSGHSEMKMVDCCGCGSLLMMLLRKERTASAPETRILRYWYYKRGSPAPVQDPFPCDRSDIPLERLRGQCPHAWIRIHELPPQTKAARRRELRQARHFLDSIGMDDMFLPDDSDEPRTHVVWCKDCGLQELR